MPNRKKVIIMALLLLCLNITAFAQITLNMSNITVKAAMEQLKKDYGYSFVFESGDVNTQKVISVNLKNKSVAETVSQILQGQEVNYEISGRNILVRKKAITPANYEQPQKKSISGKVLDENGEPVSGATVVEKNTTNGTATDIDGNFTLNNVPSNAALQISYIGYKTLEISDLTTGGKPLIITLSEESQALDEVVVIGYGVIKKIDLSGSVASVGGDRLAAVQATSVSQALQGAMPGVQVTRSSSMPGAGATIRVRGITTIGTSDPLVLVDGIPGSLSMDPDDIESVSVLKDAASASIYGARASAGVILVTTKRAKEGTLSIDYSGTAGALKATTFPSVVNYKRYMEMINETAWNESMNVPGQEYFTYSKDFIDNYAEYNRLDPAAYPICDWKEYLVNNSAPRQKHNLAINYGSKGIKSKASIGYEKTDALYNNRSYASINARINNNIKVNEYFSATVDGFYRRGISENTSVNPLQAAYKYGPLWSPVYPDGRISAGRDATNPYARLNYGGFANSWSDYFTGKIGLDFTPFKGLTITGVYAPTVSLSKGKTMVKQIPYYDYADPTQFLGYITGNLNNSLSESRGESRTTTKQLLINYSANINKTHELALLAGYEDYYAFSESLGASSDMMELASFPYLNRANLNYIAVSGSASENAYRSYFGRINYDFADRYLFQANIRADESSRFHPDHRLGIFPSFSAGWVVTQEPVIKNLQLNTLNFLKLRGSWGNLGNERIGNYPYQATMSFVNRLMMDGTNIVARNTAYQLQYAIEEITWERTEVFDAGIDATLLDNRLSLTFDWYKKITHDMLLAYEIPNFTGYSNPQQNAGIMYTKGWDLQIEWKDRIGDFRYSVSANISDYRSVMGNLRGTVFDGSQIIREGSEYNEWYGYRTDGLFLTEEELTTLPVVSPAVKLGDVKYLDISGPDIDGDGIGDPDGIISPEYDRVLLGGSLPRYVYGGNITVGYKDFDLSLSFQGIGKKTSRIAEDMVHVTSAWYTFPGFIDGKYYSHYNTDEQNAKALYPRLSTTGGVNYSMSDYWLFDGSYFRLQNITVGYTVPKKIFTWLRWFNNVRLWASASDLFSIDNYPKGWDPETATDAYITKAFNFGLQVKF